MQQVAEDMIKIMEERGRAQPAAGLGMTRKEVSTYSMVRAMHAAHTGDWSKAGLERSVSEAVAKRTGETVEQVQARFAKLNQQSAGVSREAQKLAPAVQQANQQLQQIAVTSEKTNTSLNRLFGATISMIAMKATKELVSYAWNLNKTLADMVDNLAKEDPRKAIQFLLGFVTALEDRIEKLETAQKGMAHNIDGVTALFKRY